MKYFTRELIAQLNSASVSEANAADAEWDRRLAEYEEELRRLESSLPEHIREYNGLLLHDARVYSIARQGDRLILVLQKDIPPRDLVIVTYALAGEPIINREALPIGDRSTAMHYNCNEFDMIQEGDTPLYTESILFSNGWELRLRFHGVRFTLAESLYAESSLVLTELSRSA